MAIEPIKIDGLDRFVRNLRRLDSALPKMLRVGLNEVAEMVISDIGPVPRRSGTAAKSIRARSTPRAARISGGGAKAPYYPWLDFGGTIGQDGPTRPYRKEGRFIYHSFKRNRTKVIPLLETRFAKVIRAAGIEID